MRYFLLDKSDSKEDFYVNNMHNIIENHFSISIAPVWSRDGSLVANIAEKDNQNAKKSNCHRMKIF
jgi:hypothetical protein